MKLKTISIGDLHGQNMRKFIDPDLYDLIVFIGDYMDSWVMTDTEIWNNLLDIIAFKKSYPDKVVLLIGNHDFSYTRPRLFDCPGHRVSMDVAVEMKLREHADLFKMAHRVGDVLWSHAGVSQGWFDKWSDDFQSYFDDGMDIADILNSMYLSGAGRNALNENGVKRGGFYTFGSPIWADRVEMIGHLSNPDEQGYISLPGFHQIVGHTPIEQITTYEKDEKTKVTFIDVLGLGYHENKMNFYELEIEIPES